MGRGGSYLWGSCFGRCSRVEDVPSPRPSVTSPSPNAHRKEQKSSNTRISYSDASTAELSSLSSSLLTANLGTFTVSEMKTATKAFAASNFIGEGGFGPVYKGFIEAKPHAAGGKTEAVAVKVLNLEGLQGHKEWLTEVIMLGQLRHPHLVKLIGYCYQDKHRMLVYEFMARGNLENHLFKGFSPLSWKKRINIALGAAKGLAFLHGVDQPVIYRDFKASNILLDSDHKAKLSDFGLAKDGPEDGETHVSTRVMGTHGYAAPEYIMTGHLTMKSDVYSFGVVLLELLTGRRSVDKARPSREQNLVDWAKPYLNNPRKLDQIMDPLLEGQYSIKGAQKAAELAYQCLNHLPKSRPHMCAVVDLLEPIVDYKDIPPSTFVFTVKDCNDKEKIDAKSPKEETVEKPSKPVKEDGRLRGKTPGSERHKVNAARRNARRAHRHNRGSSKTAYSDTALYRKAPRQQHRNCGI